MTNTGVLEKDIKYQFEIYLTGDLPVNSYFTMIVPSEVGMPTNSVSGLEMECN